MGVKPQVKRVVWLVWFLLVPAGIYYSYSVFPPPISGYGIEILAFLLLTSAVAAMPMVVNNNPIFLIQWVSLATFLIFGLFVEMVLVQVALVVLLLRIRIQKGELFRLPLNSIMFFLVSFLSGSLYYSLGGQHGVHLIHDINSLWLAAAYAVSYFSLNQLILSIMQVVVYKKKVSFLSKDMMWETLTTLMTFPVGFVLYELYDEAGLLAVLFIGVPFASLSIILNLYYSSEKINDYLQQAAEIGHQLAESLHVKEVIELFIQKLTEMLPVEYAYILDVVDEKELQLIVRIENGEAQSTDIPPLKMQEGISGHVWSTKKSVLFSSKKEWQDIVKGYIPDEAESIISVPIARNNKVVGILLLASKNKRAFEKFQLMIVDILCSHFAVAIENARHFEEAKEQSERCALTKLFNYRYFERIVASEFVKLRKMERKQLSLILLDIDHFKTVNDVYGHQSGNEVLCELAVRLTALAGNRGIVARYGGEEFVILLPEVDKASALSFAEVIRKAIANRPFYLHQTLDNDRKSVKVSITASLGVATAPLDADEPLALIRHADRALYVGAKRAGRNRVAEYIK